MKKKRMVRNNFLTPNKKVYFKRISQLSKIRDFKMNSQKSNILPNQRFRRKTYSGFITKLEPNQIIVFGSNPEGRHGSGVAKIALNKFGAVYGEGRGIPVRGGKSYALVTKNLTSGFYEESSGMIYKKCGFRSVSEEMIKKNISELYDCAFWNSEKEFLIAYKADGKNLNGYNSVEMAKMFMSEKIPKNIVFEDKFYDIIKKFNHFSEIEDFE